MSPNSQFNEQNIAENNLVNQPPAKRKCALPGCNKDHCRTPWHKPCVLAKYDLADRLGPMLVLVGGMEFIIGIIIVKLMAVYGNEYDKLYGTGDSKGISLACLTGSVILWISACLLIISIYWKIRRLILIHVFISTALSVYIFILSVIKMKYGLSIIEKDSNVTGRCTENRNFLSWAPCLLGLLTLLGSGKKSIATIGNMDNTCAM